MSKVGNGPFLLLYRNLETVGVEMIVGWRAALDVIWAGITPPVAFILGHCPRDACFPITFQCWEVSSSTWAA